LGAGHWSGRRLAKFDLIKRTFKVQQKSLDPATIKRVIVRGANWVGDTAITIAALRELRLLLPHAHITLATRAGNSGLLAEADFIDDLLISRDESWKSLRSEIRKWKRGNFDLAVLFPNSFQAALIPALARVPLRIGYATQGRRLLLTHPLETPKWRNERHEVYYYLNLISALEMILQKKTEAANREPDFGLTVSAERSARAQAALRSLGVTAGRPLVALCPGSINSRAKRWPAERYAALGDRLIEELNAEVLLIGSANEQDVSLAVAKQMRRQPVVATGSSSLAEATAILDLADLLITNDTGPAHIAAALGRPTIVIFGPTNPLTTGPFSANSEIIRHPPDCAPCMLRDCPIDHRCMTAISVDDVFERARGSLAATEVIKNKETSGPLRGTQTERDSQDRAKAS
jgi:heptosyltransferase-2